MKIIIFGHSGFIGTNLKEKIENQYTLILPSRIIKEPLFEKDKIFLPFNPEQNISEFKPDIVINLIGILKQNLIENYYKVHVETVQKITESSIKNKVKKIIHISALGAGKGHESSYFKTKENGEEIIKKSGIQYLIIRPALIVGNGQKIYKDIEKISRYTPFIIAPDCYIDICYIDDVVSEIINGINGKNGISEIKNKRIKYSDLFKIVLNKLGIKRYVISVNKYFFFLPAVLSKLIKSIPFDMEIYKMMLSMCNEENDS